MAFAEKLYELRKKNNLSQEQLAEQLGVSRQAISKWESGQSTPESDKLIQISNYFKVSLDYLMKEEIRFPEDQPKETTSLKTEKNGKEKLILGLIFSIGGMLCLIIWGIISILFPKASNDISDSSMIKIDGNGIALILFVLAVVVGAVLILKNSKK